MLKLTGLRKSFGEILAVSDLSLEVRPGEIFGLLGPNGAGKTTTINLAVGLLEPDDGEAFLERTGSPLDPSARRQIGIAPQAIALYEDLSARENLAFFASLYGLSGSPRQERLEVLLRLVGLESRARDRVKTYSGGMKRRLNLAAALVHDPGLILLDEPTAGVDPQSRNAIFDIVQGLKSEGRTVIYTTHYMEEAQRLCDRVGIIDHGRLLALDTVDGLIESHGGRTLVVVQGNEGERRLQTDDPASELRRLLSDGQVNGVRIERPSLESVFLSLTGRSLRD